MAKQTHSVVFIDSSNRSRESKSVSIHYDTAESLQLEVGLQALQEPETMQFAIQSLENPATTAFAKLK